MVRTDIPSSQYSPEVGVSRQPRVLSRVDLPEPEEPMMVTNSPSVMVNDTSLSAWTVSSPTMKSRQISSNLIISLMACCFYLGGPGMKGLRSCWAAFTGRTAVCTPVTTVSPSVTPEIISVISPSDSPTVTILGSS